MKSILLTSSFIFLAQLAFSQSSNEYCFNYKKTSNPAPVIEYLFKKYGESNSEKILLNMRNYEIQHGVQVLFQDEFYLMMEKIDQAIQNSTEADRINELLEKKSKFVLFSTIENQIN